MYVTNGSATPGDPMATIALKEDTNTSQFKRTLTRFMKTVASLE